MSNADRRQHPRRSSGARFVAQWDSREVPLEAADVSEGGSFLVGAEYPRVGDSIELRPSHHLAELGRVVLRGLVRHHRQAQDGTPAGIGIEWLEARAERGAVVLYDYLHGALNLYLAPPQTDPTSPRGPTVAYRFDEGRFVEA